MKIREKNILLISPERWDHIFVSKHHYAIHLAKRGNQVYFLNPPGKVEEVEATEYKNVWSVHYQKFIKGLHYFPSFVQKIFIRKKFNHLQRLCKTDFDVIWSFDNSVFFDFSALPEEILKISHIVDLNQDFQTGKAAGTANVCFCTTELIKERLIKYNSMVWKIDHGINTICRNAESKSKLPGKARIKAVLVGNLAMAYMDWFVLLQVAKSNLGIDFIFVGPNIQEFSQKRNQHHQFKCTLYNLPNTYFLGKIPSHELPCILKRADLLLLSYREEFHRDQANPHKMMEYLASGKMIVATNTMEYLKLKKEKIILMAKENKEFPQLFQSAVNKLEYWNSIEKQNARRSYALENTYDNQIDRVESLVLTLNESTVN